MNGEITLSLGAPIAAGHGPGGTSNFISWRRLAEVLERDGELRPGERLVHVTLRPDGITYTVESKS